MVKARQPARAAPQQEPPRPRQFSLALLREGDHFIQPETGFAGWVVAKNECEVKVLVARNGERAGAAWWAPATFVRPCAGGPMPSLADDGKHAAAVVAKPAPPPPPKALAVASPPKAKSVTAQPVKVAAPVIRPVVIKPVQVTSAKVAGAVQPKKQKETARQPKKRR